jgi:hypothetical protein
MKDKNYSFMEIREVYVFRCPNCSHMKTVNLHHPHNFASKDVFCNKCRTPFRAKFEKA